MKVKKLMEKELARATKEMAELLHGIGCDYLQGYYFSRPVPMEAFSEWAAKAP